ncbi:MAG TPA: hypothetical protein PLP17_06315 [Oligoflexia bacterium]|nr:hypothetical protein [Oligoflexia bacterium]
MAKQPQILGEEFSRCFPSVSLPCPVEKSGMEETRVAYGSVI